MAENDGFDDGDGQDQGNQTGKGLRAQLEQALSRVKELETANGDLQSRVRATDLSRLLESNGARKGAEGLYPKDAEVSEDAVKAWVEQNAAFVREATGDGEGSGDDGDASEESRENARRLAALADSSSQRSAGDLSNILDQIKTAKPEELDGLYAQVGLRRT